ncbi:MAG: MBL fold metallo-hydrolase [Syntrophorhabdus sp.]
MNIKWYGHSAFLLTTGDSTRIIIDPYQSGAFGGALAYGKIKDSADIVLSSHDHDDHNYVKDITGTFQLINTPGRHTVKNILIEGIPTYHDQTQGSERGRNIIYIIDADEIRVVHLGDLGHVLDEQTVKKIGKIDVLLLPVGGFYTIDAKEASLIVETLRPSITIPMHFKTDKCDFPITPVQNFTTGKAGVTSEGKTSIDLSRGTMPKSPQIIVLEHEL